MPFFCLVSSLSFSFVTGAADGSVTVLQMSRSLSEAQKDEKLAIQALFERETKREKNLELRAAAKAAKEV
jgi:dynein intermediate chain 2